MVLTAAIEALREEYRTVVVVRGVEGLSTQEIAQITGLSVACVKIRTHRARLVLRKRLGEYLSSQLPPAGRARVRRTNLYRCATAVRAADIVTGPRGATS